MNDIKIVVVDDSPFSITLLTDMLTQNGFNVVGSASSLEETKEVVTKLKPDLVTMDMTLPGTDGLECTRAIHAINPETKVIIISSMMDNEIVQKAKKNKVCGYLQKPVDPDELTLLVKRIMASDDLFEELTSLYFTIFKESFNDTFNKFTKTIPKFEPETIVSAEHKSCGICVVVGIIGKYSGRMIFDVSFDTAEKLTTALLKRAPKNDNEIHNVVGEFSNIISGTACSIINRKNKLYGLRVAPPTIFHGESLTVSKGELKTITAAIADTIFGKVYMDIGFVRGTEEWTSNI